MSDILRRKRFVNELKLLQREPLHYATAYPDKDNNLVWYFIIKGQKDTDYNGGEYIGKIMHSDKYPALPPDYMMLTPNGRFAPNSKICLTNSGYHREQWTPTWNIKTIIIAFYSIFIDDNTDGIAHIHLSKSQRAQLAKSSHNYNITKLSDIYNNFDMTHLTDDIQEAKEQEVTRHTNNQLKEQNYALIQQINNINESINKRLNDLITVNLDDNIIKCEKTIKRHNDKINKYENVINTNNDIIKPKS